MSDHNNHKINQNINNQLPSDLMTLAEVFSLPQLCYVDINLREHVAEISLRWPLLVELMQVPISTQATDSLSTGDNDIT